MILALLGITQVNLVLLSLIARIENAKLQKKIDIAKKKNIFVNLQNYIAHKKKISYLCQVNKINLFFIT